jgi:EAL domain-containing protein (putative c-di-GMP-specific phosphodiesterase class I)
VPVALEDLPVVRALRGEVVSQLDMLVKTAHGEMLLSTTANPVYDEEHVQLGAIAVFADVTAQRAREGEMHEALQAADMAIDMEEAIAAGDLVLYSQPIVDLATGQPVLEELLLRVRSRDGNVVSPCRFLEVAERYGTVAQVDDWVFQQAAHVAAAGRPVTVNVSARSVGRSSFLDLIEQTLAREGVEPWLITLEITETAVISDMQSAARFTDRLEAIGCHFALDDFGTGYAPLTYLKFLPVRYLKIDMEFVRDLVENSRSRAVVSGIVGIAAGLGQRTIAEGVEDAATLELLRELGVDLAQGFHIARPAPIAYMAPSEVPVAASPQPPVAGPNTAARKLARRPGRESLRAPGSIPSPRG